MNKMEVVLSQKEKAEEEDLKIEVKSVSNLSDSTMNQQLPTRKKKAPMQTVGICERCGYMSSQKVCKACVLLEELNKSRPKAGIGISNGVAT